MGGGLTRVGVPFPCCLILPSAPTVRIGGAWHLLLNHWRIWTTKNRLLLYYLYMKTRAPAKVRLLMTSANLWNDVEGSQIFFA